MMISSIGLTLQVPLSKALGDRTAQKLGQALDLHTVGDLLRHYPRRYAERGRLTPLSELEAGEHVTVLAEVRRANVRTTRSGRQLLEVVVTDGTGLLTLTFFGKAAWRVQELRAGRRGLFSGQVTTFNMARQLSHPDYQLDDTEDAASFAGALLPIYAASQGLPSWNIAKAVGVLLDVVDVGDDPLPAELRAQHALMPLAAALRAIHCPSGRPELHAAQRRLTWDEALVLQVVLAQRRIALRAQPGVGRPGRADGLLAAFDAATPFVLTAGQRDVGEVLAAELADSHPMHRLLQGEVGSGKTLVALRAMLSVVDSGGQCALLAPTEVLAQQHARSLRDLLGPLARAGELDGAEVATRVALLTGSVGSAERRAVLQEVGSGAAGLVVGTHALLSKGVEFHDLALIVIDEQHRFGVEQRDALRAKGAAPHTLVMTATPIPRTVAMTVYGDLEVSTLRELPRGRAGVTTHLAPADQPKWMERSWQRIRDAAAAGRQSFVVCPRIGDEDAQVATDNPAGEDPGWADSTDLGSGGHNPPDDDSAGEHGRRPMAGVLQVLTMLSDGPLAGLRVAALHGRMPAEAKEQVMAGFSRGEIDVLVATTVIEVGIDVPTATVMIVLDADRFGVSQLHQLRGRVGRGSDPALCLLVTAVSQGSPAFERLAAVAATNDGFELARVDLEHRREGDVLGAVQSGTHRSLRLLRLQDEEVIGQARAAAQAIVEPDPTLTNQPALAAAVRSVLTEDRANFLDKG